MDILNENQDFLPGEELFKGLLESAPDAIVIVDESGSIVIVNAQTQKLFGYKREELLGQKIEILIPERFTSKHIGYRNNFFENPKTRAMGHSGINLFGRKIGGEEFPVEVSLSPFHSGNKHLISASIRDITDRRKVEELFKGLLESAPDAIIIADNSGEIVIVNAQAENLFGYKREEMLGQKIEFLIPERFRSGHIGHRTGFFNAPKTRPMGHPGINLLGKRKNGEEFPVEVSLGPFNSGEKLLISASIRDITERLKVQTELTNIKEFVFLTEAIPQLIWTGKSNGDLDYFNKRWYEYTGLSKEESINDKWLQVLHPDYREICLEEWRTSIERGNILEMEYPLKRSDGIYRWFLNRAIPMKNNNGEIVKWLGTSTDIDDQKRQTKELENKNVILTKINNDLDNFIYTASHDLKAPISNIEGLINVLNKSLNKAPSSDEMFEEIMRMIFKSINRFKLTIQDLTDISKAQRNLEEDIEEIDIQHEIESVKESIRNEIIKHDAQIRIDTKECQNILFSRRNFRSIIQNLITNAVKYRSPERKPLVQITSKKDGVYNIIQVKDNGLGIKEGNKDKIFGMFKRLHHHVEGTGIGLYIVKRIIENSGGRIEVESQEGEGSSFNIYFKKEVISIDSVV